MSNVNADLGELLQAANGIKTAISSIETTKNSLSKKYQQIGSEWKDKKYKELGDVVQECNKALNDILKTLLKGEKYVSALAQILQEYESVMFGQQSSHNQTASGKGEHSVALGSNGLNSFLSRVFNRNQNIYEALKGVEHRPIMPAVSERSEQQIISSISGGDMTQGSCSSLAFAYAGNRAGYIVYDFRNGRSREVFSSRSSVEQIANMDGVNSVIQQGTDDTACAERLMSSMEVGREYYLATGAHAAVVRLNSNGVYQYLELQSGIQEENGWHTLTPWSLYQRFGCEDGQLSACSSYLIELDSLQNNEEFLNLLGYINTNESEQVRGERGHVR